MKKNYTFVALMLAFVFCPNFCLAIDPVLINVNQYQIDHTEKLIVVNQEVGQINVAFPGTKDAIMLDELFSFDVPLTTVAIGTAYAVKNQSNISYVLYFTQLPLVNITTTNEIVDDPRVLSQFTFSESNGNVVSSRLGIEIRGGTSRFFPKKSYRIEFWADDEGLNSVDYSFLGMRSDDDWNLQAMYNEPLKLRGKTNNELWREIHTLYYQASEPDAITGVRMEYVELFLNGAYKGVYALSERVDRKQLKLKKTRDNGTIRGELYKGENNGVANRFLDTDPLPVPPEDPFLWGGFGYEYPDEIAPDWTLLRDFVSFVVYEDDATFSAEYKNKFDVTNAADYYIYMNLMRALDNRAKNLFIAKYDANQPYFYVPWDLDGTFGNDPLGDRDNITNDVLTNGLYNRLNLQTEIGGYARVVKARWDALRASVITVPNIMSMFMQNHDYLLANAVYEREEMVWDFTYDSDNLTYINDWTTERLAFLDNYFATNFTLSLADLQNQSSVKMYPNPAVDRVNIALANHAFPIETSIYTLTGQKVLQQTMNNNSTSLDVSRLSAGIYIVVIQSDALNETKKLIIKK